jgi:hypothetical protein
MATAVALDSGPAIGRRGYVETFGHGWRLRPPSAAILGAEFARRFTPQVEDAMARFAQSLVEVR